MRVIHGLPEASVFWDGEEYVEKNDTSSEGLMNLEYVWVPTATLRRMCSAARIVKK